MKCYIICSAPDASIEPIKKIKKGEGDIIICADGGYEYARAAGIKPDIVVGDFDSAKDGAPKGDFELFTFDTHKDDTDTMIAVKEGMARGCTEFLFYAATGGRFDHMFANVLLLLWIEKQGFKAMMIDDEARYFFIGKKYVFPKEGRRTVSLFAIDKPVKGITLHGFEYPLNNYDMATDVSLGISNVITGDDASIETTDGRLFVVEFFKKQ
ncbi:MAG: thiamine diphosphokinase [Clostridia bacterium]|nr:thiamine diphosphokinase [Clostridia bacterium]